MLAYLVTSKARRRLLALLWGEKVKGTVTELADRANVSFPSAYRELREMERWGLAVSTHDENGTTFVADESNPDADLLVRLAKSTAASRAGRRSGDGAEVRAHLAAVGAPLRSAPATTPSPPLPQVLVEGLKLARRDPEVARSMPVLLHRYRDEMPSVVEQSAQHGLGHTLGFLLAVTSRLTGDRSMARTAAKLRDRRVRRQEFFLLPPSSSGTTFPLARAWGLRMRVDLEWFGSLFEKLDRIDRREPN
ncbi:MAG TPA: hypothetical protein VL463_09440 [Kofleriaceae bacterium]|nr:hypothetical protein [Kofleriaceae bacterium]